MEDDVGAVVESINDDEKTSSRPGYKRHPMRGIGFNATSLVSCITTHGCGKIINKGAAAKICRVSARHDFHEEKKKRK